MGTYIYIYIFVCHCKASGWSIASPTRTGFGRCAIDWWFISIYIGIIIAIISVHMIVKVKAGETDHWLQSIANGHLLLLLN